MRYLIFLLGGVVLLSACSQQPPAADNSLGSTHSENFERLLNAADIEGLVNLYTEDARVMPPNGIMRTGRAAVRQEFGAMIDAQMKINLNSIDSQAIGNVAYNVGTYALELDGQTIDKGKWIETWQRGADGSWRVSNDIWNSDNPPVAEEKKTMTHLVGTHKVLDAVKWLAAWRGKDGRRKDFAANGAPHVHVMQSPDDPNLTGLIIGLEDPVKFDAWLKSDAGQAAAAADTVDMSTITILREVD